MRSIVCPSCQQPLDRQPRTWRCPAGHSFDVAREGYVNLLLAQQRNSPEPGDSAEMVRARREFLDSGRYQPLRDATIDLLAPLGLDSLLDVGCGEGYYTAAFPAVAREVIGLDIAKPAIRLAAKRRRDITWLVASGAHLPIADASIDLVASFFCPLHVQELHRVLKPGGSVLLATPGPDHLHSLRAGLFEEVRPHEPEKFIATFGECFALSEQREIAFDLDLDNLQLRQLVSMTPYAWKARPERRVALETAARFTTRAQLRLMRFSLRETPAPAQ